MEEISWYSTTNHMFIRPSSCKRTTYCPHSVWRYSRYSEEQAIKVFWPVILKQWFNKNLIKSIINHNYNESSRVILKQWFNKICNIINHNYIKLSKGSDPVYTPVDGAGCTWGTTLLLQLPKYPFCHKMYWWYTANWYPLLLEWSTKTSMWPTFATERASRPSTRLRKDGCSVTHNACLHHLFLYGVGIWQLFPQMHQLGIPLLGGVHVVQVVPQ